MVSRYLLQIIDRKTGRVIQLEPGLDAEIKFIEDCTQRILSLGVGIGRTAKHVEQDVKTGIELALLDLKTRVSNAD